MILIVLKLIVRIFGCVIDCFWINKIFDGLVFKGFYVFNFCGMIIIYKGLMFLWVIFVYMD